jgi:hypothetical protein
MSYNTVEIFFAGAPITKSRYLNISVFTGSKLTGSRSGAFFQHILMSAFFCQISHWQSASGCLADFNEFRPLLVAGVLNHARSYPLHRVVIFGDNQFKPWTAGSNRANPTEAH